MRLRPSWLLLAAALELGLLAHLAHGGEPPRIGPGEAPAFEGQGDVVVAGLVRDVRPGDGRTRLSLQAGSDRLDVLVEGPVRLPEGAWAEARGRLARLGGTLMLLVEAPDRVAATPPPAPHRPSWAQLAAEPEAWSGIPVEVRGIVERGTLKDGDGHRIALGEGPWPKAGAVRAIASIGYDEACVCHRLHAIEATADPAWTS